MEFGSLPVTARPKLSRFVLDLHEEVVSSAQADLTVLKSIGLDTSRLHPEYRWGKVTDRSFITNDRVIGHWLAIGTAGTIRPIAWRTS
jgi:hypothetical protein